MMKENSPIWARLSPVCTASGAGVPANIAPSGDADQLAHIRTTTRSASAGQCAAMSCGSIIMPTETKKTAAKTSRSGRDQFFEALGHARLGHQRAGQEGA